MKNFVVTINVNDEFRAYVRGSYVTYTCFNSDSYVHSPGHSLGKLLKHWSRRLYLAVWTTATRFSME